MTEYLGFTLLTLSTIALLIIPITFDNRIEGWDEIIENLKYDINELREFRHKSSDAIESYYQLKLINEIYKSVTVESNRIGFIEDNINERLRKALRYTAVWDSKFNEVELKTEMMSTDLIFKNIFHYQKGMAATLDKLIKDVIDAENRQEKLKKYKQWVIIFCIILNTGGLIFGFISTKSSNSISSKEVIDELRKIETEIPKVK